MAEVQAQHTRSEKETIHSGHFMVSHFEAEAQDDYDDLAVPVPEEEHSNPKISGVVSILSSNVRYLDSEKKTKSQQQLSIETSLTKLFKCMTLAYRQKLTSPKWNRFKGIKLRWKDKIRLNNVIWRCWHMQFIKKQNTLVCQFASPLDVDTHVKPETTILEGKYWKRRAEAVKAEYKKWRMFHITRLLGKGDTARDTLSDMEALESLSQCGDMAGSMLMDEDYITFMSDTLFSTITSHQPFAFPDTREIARGASLADFIQPSLGPLQPNLDDFMDTLEPLQELLSASRLPPVPEESALTSEEQMYRGPLPLPLEQYGAHYLPAASALSATQMHVQGSNAVLALSVQEVMQPVKNEQAQFECAYRPEPAPAQYRAPYEHHAATSVADAHLYPIIKSSSSPYHQKLPHQDITYTKPYAPTIPTPSQTAPETVSLLQQPISAQKMNAAVLANRQSYQRDRPSRARATQFSSQQTSHYPYAPPVQLQNTVYDTRSNQRPGQVQYLQPLQMDTYKPKNMPSANSNQRSFKLPSPPLANISPQQGGTAQAGQAGPAGQAGRQHSPAAAAAAATAAAAAAAKESFRSNSLPVGAHLNADWSISTLATPTDAAPRVEGVVGVGGLVRVRARSSSGGEGEGCGAGGVAGTGRRVPPPLASVNSEPSLPHSSVMLAQLLTHQHSQSMYKLSNTSAGATGAAGGSKEPSPRCSNEALSSPQPRTLPSPTAVKEMISPLHGVSPAGSPPESPGSPPEPRRATHLHAEQKRRYNIKNGFDTLQSLIPHLNNNPAAKVSKAAMLQKGAEYIKQLKAERNQINEEMENLRQQITSLNNSISNCHSLLPATGAPVSRARAGRLREMFARHVAHRTMHNWKYWLFSVVGGMLVESFSNCVSNSSGGDLVRTTLLWAEQHCSLVEMRPAVLSSLRVLCTTTDILSNPERLPEEARAAVTGASNIKTEPS